MAKMKVFISQPMRGRSSEEIKEERTRILATLSLMYKDSEIEEIQSYFEEDVESKNPPVAMLGKSIELMAEADLVVLAPDWCVARGCVIEEKVAYDYGLEIVDMD